MPAANFCNGWHICEFINKNQFEKTVIRVMLQAFGPSGPLNPKQICADQFISVISGKKFWFLCLPKVPACRGWPIAYGLLSALGAAPSCEFFQNLRPKL
jgi:hypothetical protein